jgi:adenylyl- and sulfurtransferase ThiI
MIKAEYGEVTVKGSAVFILAEFTLIIKAVKESLEDHGVPDEEVRELIALSGKRAFMSEEEFEKELEELTGIKEKAVK